VKQDRKKQAIFGETAYHSLAERQQMARKMLIKSVTSLNDA